MLDRLGGFDDGFPFPHCEDLDLAFRVLREAPIGYSDDMRILHHAREAGFRDLTARGRMVVSEMRLFERHRSRYGALQRLPAPLFPIAQSFGFWRYMLRAAGRHPARIARALAMGIVYSLQVTGSVLRRADRASVSVAPLRMALLVAPESFERFYTDGLGLDRAAYVDDYRNDFVWTYARGLRDHGVETIAYVPSLGPPARERADDGFEVRFLSLPAVWTRLRALIARAVTPVERYAGEALQAALLLPELRRGLREDGADLLYVQEYWTGRFDVLAHASPVPVVAGEHGGSSGVHVHVLKRRSLARAAAVTVQSSAEQRRLRTRYGADPRLVTNGIDTTFFTPGPNAGGREARPPRMLVVARLVDAQKRVSDVISALARMPAEWGLDVVGRGPDEAALREHAERLGVAGRVAFHGWVGSREELRDRYRSCGVFVLPSTWEAVTLALLEAMACGAPPVVTPLPAFRDVIEDGVNGALVPPFDPERLAEVVLATHADGARIGAAARRTVEQRYDRAATLGELAGILRDATVAA